MRSLHADNPSTCNSMRLRKKTRFTDAGLVSYDVLIFLINTGEVLDATGKAALQRHFDHGGNFVAIHSASDCLRNTTFYGREVGAFFDSHPALQNASVFDPFVIARLCNEQCLRMRDCGRDQCVASE